MILKKTLHYTIVGIFVIFGLVALLQPVTVSSPTGKRYNSRTDYFIPTNDSLKRNPLKVAKGNSFNRLQKPIIGKDTIPDDTSRSGINYRIIDEDDLPYQRQFKSPLLYTPPNINSDVEYNPKSNDYQFYRKAGKLNLRNPYSMDFKEYQQYNFDKSIKNYWRDRTRSESFGYNPSIIPSLHIGGEVFDFIFGSNTIDIKPQGSAELMFGVNIYKDANPSLPENLQRSVTFDFDEKIEMGVTGQIGDKMKLGINYNTKATFDFENETKLGYTGKEDEIIQSIEAGNVSLPLNGSLITGAHSLFGFKTELKFGRLTMTNIFSQQRGKSQEINLERGAQINDFEVSAGDYEANRHFFLSHYFRENYDKSMASLPVITSGITITRIEVWVTNKTANFNNSRNIIAFMDLAEKPRAANHPFPWHGFITYSGSTPYPANETNSLYEKMLGISELRNINNITAALQSYAISDNFTDGQDFEKLENARLLAQTEYTLNPTLGYISLNSALNADEVLAIAYEYNMNGKTYRVGEFSNGSIAPPSTLIVKLLKGTSLTPRLPTWDLMMKNVYSLGAYQVNNQDFMLDILYRNDATGTDVSYITEGVKPDEGGINGMRLLRAFKLDNLNSQLDPVPDGLFDYIENYTINSSSGRVIFPVIEPFGKYLRDKITAGKTNDIELNAIADKYTFEELYDSTQTRAQLVAEKNKFVIKGTYKSSSGSEIMLNAMNIPDGSVKVTANGAQLTEGTDYIVDYTLGRVTILNTGLLESGTPIKISLESQSLFNMGTKTLFGTHFNYQFSEKLNLGGTILRLSEKPLTNKVSFGDEAISNTIWGLDAQYNDESPFLTRLVDKIPLINTKEKSTIIAEAEFAYLVPGHAKAIERDGGASYIDDFEGSKITLDLKTYSAWSMASVPHGQPSLFPEASFHNDLANGYNRAKLAWYHVLSDLLRSNAPKGITAADQSNHFVREIYEQEIFPNRESPNGYPLTLSVLNVAYYPQERGPYNYDVTPYNFGGRRISAGINEEGFLNEPQTRWGGIMRKVPTNDFETSNIEFIEFWLMDPFVYDSAHFGGDLYFNLGNVSEDVLRDSRKSFEQGLPTTADGLFVDTTAWGRVSLQQQLFNAFDNEPNSRIYQDVGLDGLHDGEGDETGLGAEEKFFSNYLEKIKTEFGATSTAYQQVLKDPSSDNYHYFKGSDFDDVRATILDRYKNYNGMEGNSPTADQSPESFSTTGTLLPDMEDVNRDNTLSENETYYQYHVSIRPEDMVVGKNYITDMVVDSRKRKDNKVSTVRWYQFKIPVFDPDGRQTIGNIADFKSIRFMRMFLNGFEDTVVLRFAKLDLVRGEWRKYNFPLQAGNEEITYPQEVDATFDVSAVNIEENSSRKPVNYVLPPGVTRVIDPTNPHYRQLNEQSLVLKAIDLEDGDARATYKNTQLDVRQYKKMQLEVHAEAIAGCGSLRDGEVRAFIRLGTDYKDNYYEYEIPLEVTIPENLPLKSGNLDRYAELVWPEGNHIEVDFNALQRAKQYRNNERRTNPNIELSAPYTIMDGENRVTVVGNPDLSSVRTIMLGIRNPKDSELDDGMPKCVEVWMNELRLTDFNEEGGWAANARVTARLADFGTITLTGGTSKPGFGSIEKKVNDRQKEEVYQYDVSSNFELGKFFPKKAGVRLPMYIGYSERFSNPQYNPLDNDIPLEASLSDPELSKSEKDEIRKKSQDYTRRKSINFTNIKIAPGENAKPQFYSIANWSASYAFTELYSRNINTEFNLQKTHFASLGYLFSLQPKTFEPFKSSKSKILNSQALRLVKDFNVNYYPRQLAFRTDINKSFNAFQLRNLNEMKNQSLEDIAIPVSFKRDFIWNRSYDLKWDFSRNLKFDYMANATARVDEPQGWIDEDHLESEIYNARRDSVWNNILNGGRTTQYQHRINVIYNVPINKLPLLDGFTLSTRYGATFDWATGPMTADTIRLGNIVKNSNNIQLNGAVNLVSIYNKIGFLKKLNDNVQGRGTKQEKTEVVAYEEKDVKLRKLSVYTINHKLGTRDVQVEATGIRKVEKSDDAKIDPNAATNQIVEKIDGKVEIVNDDKIKFTASEAYDNVKINVQGRRKVKDNPFKQVLLTTAGLVLSLKNISATYTETNGTYLPGYMPETNYFGGIKMNNTIAPGIPFLLGWQDRNFPGMAAENGWLTTDSLLNNAVSMAHTDNLNLRTSLEPIPGLRIDINATWNRTRNTNEYWLFKNDKFAAYNSMFTGNFSISIMPINTAFWKIGKSPTYDSKAYNNFKIYRKAIAFRLATQRGATYKDAFGNTLKYDINAPNKNPLYDPKKPDSKEFREDGFPNGYGPTSQEVLIPALLAAYTDQSPDKISLSPFPRFPLPNWRITYEGLRKSEFLKKYFKSISINHSYRALYSIGGFSTNPYYDFDGADLNGFSYVTDEINKYFIPKEEISAVSIKEDFSPFLSLDMTMNSSLMTRMEYKKARDMSLSFSNNRMVEMHSSEIVVGIGYRFSQLPINLKLPSGKQQRFQSDLNVRADISVRDMTNIIRELGETVTTTENDPRYNNAQTTGGQRNIAIKFNADYMLSERFNLRFYYDQTINDPKASTSYRTSNTKVGISVRFTLIP